MKSGVSGSDCVRHWRPYMRIEPIVLCTVNTYWYILVSLNFIGAEAFFRRVCTVAKSAYWFRHVRPSVRMYQSGFHRTDVCKIWYWWLIWKSIIIIHVWLKWGKISCNLQEDLGIFYCCRRHKLTIKALLFITQYFHIFVNDRQVSNV